MGRFKLADLRNKHILALAGNGIIAVFGMGTIALLSRSLDKADLGLWFLFLTIYSLGDAIRGGLLGTATIKFYAGADKERADNVLGSVWFLALMVTGILTLADVIGFFFLPFIHDKQLSIPILWFGATFVSSLPFNIIFGILTAEERYGKILWLRLVNSGSMVIVIIILMVMHKMTLNALLWCNLLTNCLTSLVGLLSGWGKVTTIRKRSKASILEITNFGKYILGSTFVSKLLNSCDTFVISIMLGPQYLAVYGLPIKLMEIVEFPLRSFVGTGMSAMAAAYNQNNIHQTTYILKKFTGMLTLAFIPLTLGAVLLADVAIDILGGAKYMGTEAANLYRILMLLALLYPLDRFTGVTLDIVHQPRINFYKVIVMLAVNFTANFAGVALFGNLYGISFGSLFTVVAGAYFGYYNLKKHLSFTLREIIASGIYESKLLIQKVTGK